MIDEPFRKKRLEIQKQTRCSKSVQVMIPCGRALRPQQVKAKTLPLLNLCNMMQESKNMRYATYININQFKHHSFKSKMFRFTWLCTGRSCLQIFATMCPGEFMDMLTKYHFALRFDDTLSCTSHLNLHILHAFCILLSSSTQNTVRPTSDHCLPLTAELSFKIFKYLRGPRFRRDIVDPCPCIFSDLWDTG